MNIYIYIYYDYIYIERERGNLSELLSDFVRERSAMSCHILKFLQ